MPELRRWRFLVPAYKKSQLVGLMRAIRRFSTRTLITRSVHPVLPLAKGELEGVLLLKQKNLPRPLLGKEGSIYSQPLREPNSHVLIAERSATVGRLSESSFLNETPDSESRATVVQLALETLGSILKQRDRYNPHQRSSQQRKKRGPLLAATRTLKWLSEREQVLSGDPQP